MSKQEVVVEVQVKGTESGIKSIKDLKNALKEAKDEQVRAAEAFGVGSKEYLKATKSLGELKDKFDDLGDSTKSLRGSGVEGLTSSFGLLNEGIGNFDFDKIKTGFKGIGSAMSAIPIFLIIEGVKLLIDNFDKVIDFGRTLFNVINDDAEAVTKLNLAVEENARLNNDNLQSLDKNTKLAILRAKEAGKSELELQEVERIGRQNRIKYSKEYYAETIDNYNKLTANEKATIADTQKSFEAMMAAKKALSNEETDLEIFNIEKRIEGNEKEKEKKIKIEEDREKDREERLKKEKSEQDLKFEEFTKRQQEELNNLKLKQSEEQRLKEEARFGEMTAFDVEMAKTDAKLEERNKKIAENRAKEKAEHEAFEKDKVNITANATLKGLQSVQALSDLYFTFKRNNLKKGSAEELEAAKKQFKINKALAITTATIQGVQAVLAAFSSGAAVPVVGAVLGPAYAAFAGIVAGANIAKIAASKFDGGGDSASASAGGGTPTVNIPSPPSFDTAKNNTQTNFDSEGNKTGTTGVSTNPTINVNATIGVDEVSSKQNRVKALERQATF
jgi:hypothetical protein